MEGVEEERGEGRRQIWYAHRGDPQVKKNKNTVFGKCITLKCQFKDYTEIMKLQSKCHCFKT